MTTDPTDKLILALDGMDKDEAFCLIQTLPKLQWVKVGLELFMREGPEVIFSLREMGFRVFLDLKFHDIPNTMAAACHQAAKSGAELITVHACAGINALNQANNAASTAASEAGFPPPTLLAVTVLTSWDSNSFANELVTNQPLHKRVELLANLASKAGIGGCICSPLEVKQLRNLFSDSFELVTPGIRPKGSSMGDQLRVMTPSEALNAGASRIVLGRPITESNDPISVFEGVCSELEKV